MYKKNPPLTLYHGTDMRIIRMTDDEREEFKQRCINAIDYMWQFIEPYTIEVEKLKKIRQCIEPVYVFENRLDELEKLFKEEKEPCLFQNLNNAIICNQERLKGNTQYEYKYTYLTSRPINAMNYASRSYLFGEVGLITYRFYQTINKMTSIIDWNPSKSIKETLDKLISFVHAEPEPVVVVVQNYDIKYLYRDSGNQIDEKSFINGRLLGHCLYKEHINLSDEEVVPLSEFRKRFQ